MRPSSPNPNGRSVFHPDKAPSKTHLFVSIYNDKPLPTSPPPTTSPEAPGPGAGPPHHHHHHHRHHLPHHHRWTVLVEQPPKHHHRLSLHHHHSDPDPVPTLFLIGRDNNATSSWACHSRPLEPSDADTHLGKIHIGDADAKQASTVQVEEVLRARLLPPERDSAGPPERDGAEEEGGRGRTSEHWIRAAVHALQDGGLVRKFDLDEFMTFARAYVVERSQVVGEGLEEDLAPPVAVEYVPASVVVGEGGGGGGTAVGVKNLKTTTTGGRRGFWLSWPHSAANASSTSPGRSREASPYGGLM